MIGLQIMMPAGSWPPVPVRASSRHIRSWGDSGHAGHIGGTAALDPPRHQGAMPTFRNPACPRSAPFRISDFRRRHIPLRADHPSVGAHKLWSPTTAS
jgi:hypothetical protein